MRKAESNATASVEPANEQFMLKVGGTWRLTENLPQVEQVMPREAQARPLKVVPADLASWDSSLPLFLLRVRGWCEKQHAKLDIGALPDALKELFQILAKTEGQHPEAASAKTSSPDFSKRFRQLKVRWKSSIAFIGDCALSAVRTPAHPKHFSWRDFLEEMIDAGPNALPIIGVLSFLIGLTFAFDTAMQLRRFGAQAYVIPGVGMAVLRETGPMIGAVMLAGRTGAAFAARISNMKLGGELDALELLGVSPVQYLILPRIVALVLMMPFITLYADLCGVLGGMVIAVAKLDMPAVGFWVGLQDAVGLRDLNVGLVKGAVFGALVALTGTLAGLHSERSSLGVGRAVTSAVVQGIAAIVMADALFAPILKELGI